MDSARLNINKLVSLTFDENPQVRKQAARMLGAVEDPAAKFALVELSFDKDPGVREAAQQFLDKKKQSEPELMSFATLFAAGAKKEEKEETPTEVKEKVLRPITQIFERRLGKEKAEMVKSKMMPSIEKMYQKAQFQHTGKKKSEEAGRKVMQEFLTSYLEVISDLDRIEGTQAPLPVNPLQQEHKPVPREVPPPTGEEDPREGFEGDELEVLGKDAELDKVSSEVAGLEMHEIEETREREEIEHMPDTFFKKAYETMMLSNGDEDVMKQEMNRMIEDARKEIGLAFRLARKRFKETKITNITKIHDGMRNINTDLLFVKAIDNMEYQRTKNKKAHLTRLLVNDESGNEGIVYLFESRGLSVTPAMHIKIVGGLAKTFEFSNETALTLGKKGNIYIVL